ncbi:hypothetical protein LPJ77_005274, partial [Coemansia sp. RSA 2523]
KNLKEAALLTDPTNQVALVLDTQPSPQADRAGPAAPAADAPALPKEPEDVEMAGDTTAKPSFAAVVVHTLQSPGPSKDTSAPVSARPTHQQLLPAAPCGTIKEIHDITFFLGWVTRFTVSPKYYHCFLYQCEAMMWARQERPGQWTKSTIAAPVRGSPIPTGDESNEHSHSGGHEHSRSGGHKHSRDAGDKHSHSEGMEHSRGLNELGNFHVNLYEADWGSGSSHQREVATGDYHQGDETDDDNSK